MRAALKVMHPILSCWLMLSEVNVSGMAEEVEPSCQYSVTFCCCMTDGSRRAVWQDGVWRRNAYEAKMWNNSSMWKKWHTVTFIDACWMFMETKMWMWAQWGGGGAFQQWWQQQWPLRAWHAGSSSSLAKMHSQWWWLLIEQILNYKTISFKQCYCALIISCSSMEINRRHYFQGDLPSA